MAKRGWDVYAGVRKQQDADSLVQEHPAIRPVIIDVLKPETVAQASSTVQLVVGKRGIQALVNNAGKVTLAPLEFMPMEVFEDIMEVNLTGVLRLTQAFMPMLRSGAYSPSGIGPSRIINISSQAGTVGLPLFGAYSASKFALEGLSDCLRYELDGSGVKVVVIKPGAVQTPIWAKGAETSGQALAGLPPLVGQLYGKTIERISKATKQAEDKGVTAEDVAELIYTAASVEEPRSRYLIGQEAVLQMTARRLLPDKIWDKLLLKGLAKFDA